MVSFHSIVRWFKNLFRSDPEVRYLEPHTEWLDIHYDWKVDWSSPLPERPYTVDSPVRRVCSGRQPLKVSYDHWQRSADIASSRFTRIAPRNLEQVIPREATGDRGDYLW